MYYFTTLILFLYTDTMYSELFMRMSLSYLGRWRRISLRSHPWQYMEKSSQFHHYAA